LRRGSEGREEGRIEQSEGEVCVYVRGGGGRRWRGKSREGLDDFLFGRQESLTYFSLEGTKYLPHVILNRKSFGYYMNCIGLLFFNSFAAFFVVVVVVVVQLFQRPNGPVPARRG